MVKVTKKVEQTFEGHIVVLGKIYWVIEFLADKYAKIYNYTINIHKVKLF